MSAPAVAPRLARWLAACTTLCACFSDGGQPPAATGLVTTTGTTEIATTAAPTSTSTATANSTTAATTTDAATTAVAPPVCGDGVLEGDEACDDGNLDDADACLSDCQVATCGDGVILPGVEECDAGDANHPSDPDAACRTTCELPACGDGALYLGPLGPEIVVAAQFGVPEHSNDAPRAIGVDAAGDFSFVYSAEAFLPRLYRFKLGPDGQVIDEPTLFFNSENNLRDAVIAVAPGGDVGYAWRTGVNGGDIFALGVVAGVEGNGFNAIAVKSGTQESPSVALDDLGRLVLAFTSEGNNDVRHIYVRLLEQFDDDSPPEFQVSEHLVGAATSPTVALAPTGAFAVAWGDPQGAIVYRRFSPDGAPGPVITSSLRTGGFADAGDSQPWTGAAIRPGDASVILAGLGPDHLLNLERFDASDVQQQRVAVSAAPRLYTPYVDLASDPWDNLAVAWATCGAPEDIDADCDDLPHDLQLAWIRSDMSLHAPPTLVHSGEGPPPPIGLAVAPTGVTAVTFVRGEENIVRIAPITCP